MTRDFFDPLVDEMLSEVAESFFEARRNLDRKIDLFYSYVGQLARRQERVSKRAAFLNHLLMNDADIENFYRMLGVDPTLFMRAGKIDPDAGLLCKPSGLGARRKFTQTVLDAYHQLQTACDQYLFGQRRAPRPNGPGGTDADYGDAYYGLILRMLEILNQEIDKINCCLSPSCSLQFAKKFQTDTLQKERITGTGAQSYDDIDRKLRYTPIDPADLDLVQYPPLPGLQEVSRKIERFCKSFYAANVDAVKELVKDLQCRAQDRKT
jgi:hypothetical protein